MVVVRPIHPVNRDDLPFRLISGLVDLDRFYDGGIYFPAVWAQPDFSGVLPKGTPVAQCFAVPRAPYDVVVESFDDARAAVCQDRRRGAGQNPVNAYRKQFPARRGRSLSRDRRSEASSSQRWPWDDDVNAMAMVPNVDGQEAAIGECHGLRASAPSRSPGFLQRDTED